MDGLALSLLYAWLAGLMIPLGGLIARVERIRPDWLETEVRHSVIAFGGGVLLAAVAFVLVPEGSRHLSPGWVVAALMAGGLVLAGIDRATGRRGGNRAQFLAMVSDFVPEAAALGALMATGEPVAGLLAFLIGLQNLPEGFNAWREGLAAKMGAGRLLRNFALLSLLGPAAAAAGYLLLAGMPAMLGLVMLVAAGGIVFLTFQDIAVAAHMDRREAPALCAVGGFAFGLLGQLLVG